MTSLVERTPSGGASRSNRRHVAGEHEQVAGPHALVAEHDRLAPGIAVDALGVRPGRSEELTRVLREPPGRAVRDVIAEAADPVRHEVRAIRPDAAVRLMYRGRLAGRAQMYGVLNISVRYPRYVSSRRTVTRGSSRLRPPRYRSSNPAEAAASPPRVTTTR